MVRDTDLRTKGREIPQALMRMGSGELLHQSHSRVIDRI